MANIDLEEKSITLEEFISKHPLNENDIVKFIYKNQKIKLRININQRRITLLSIETKEIPNIIGLRTLWCSFCPNLKEIPNIAGLQILDCYDCPNLKEIPNITGLQTLNCSNCPNLKEIPNIIGLRYLN